MSSAYLMTFSLLFAASGLADFTYEVHRAQASQNEYAQTIFRDERIHTRRATNGSTIETYCATIQFRNSENRVQQGPFFWVVRVRPASGYLSDYERGTWEGGASGNPTEFQKLCESMQDISDFDLLRSAVHSSDGSVYDPTNDTSKAVTRD